ncbi:MAG: hypothetical protein ACUVTY_08945 [Armatimonadota bacterium]
MQTMLERERNQHIRHRSANVEPKASCENWLFICDRCGQPIRYDEPLQVNCAKGKAEIAHLQCSRY